MTMNNETVLDKLQYLLGTLRDGEKGFADAAEHATDPQLKTLFTERSAQRTRLARMHQRAEDGTLTEIAGFTLPQEPEVEMGGHGLYSTAEDYLRFIRMWLADGAGPHGRVLQPETVKAMGRDGLAPMVEGLIVGLANVIEERLKQSDEAAVPEAAATVAPPPASTPANDPLADAGVVPDLPAAPTASPSSPSGTQPRRDATQ